MALFLTTTRRFTDEHGTIRHAYVSWPVWIDNQSSYSVKDVDGSWFTVQLNDAIFSTRPTKTANLSDDDYVLLKRDPGIHDFTKAYKEYFGIDVTKNQFAEYEGGSLSDEDKKALINEGTDSTQEVAKSYRRNLYIQP